MAKPIVVFIREPSRARKTTLGRALVSRLDAVSLTTDDLTLAARAITTYETHSGLFLIDIQNMPSISLFVASKSSSLTQMHSMKQCGPL